MKKKTSTPIPFSPRLPLAALPILSAGICCFLSAAPLQAQQPIAQIDSIFPPGGKRGSTVEVDLGGSNLEVLRGVHLSSGSVTAELIANNKVRIKIPADAKGKAVELRVFGRFGMSNPLIFSFSDRNELNEAPDLLLPLETVVNGRTDNEKIDSFKFAAKAGQAYVIHCEARKIGSPADATIVLRDPAGRQVKKTRKPHLAFKAPADGEYTIGIHDYLFKGGSAHVYRLAVTDKPMITSYFPGAAQLGTKQTYKVQGHNLTQDSIEIAIPADPAAATASLPAGLALTEYPVIAAEEKAEAPLAVTVPCDISARFDRVDDEDWFSFPGKKGQTLWFEVLSERLGHAVDPLLVLHQVKSGEGGKETINVLKEVDDGFPNQGGNHFNTSSRDPALSYVIPEDGEYRILVYNQFTNHSPDHSYRLLIHSPKPDVELYTLPQNPGDQNTLLSRYTPTLWKGGSVDLRVIAVRHQGHTDPIELQVKGLPEFIQATPATIAKGQASANVIITTKGEVKDWAGPLSIVGKTSDREYPIVGTTLLASGDAKGVQLYSRTTPELGLAVIASQSAAFTLRPKEAGKVYEMSLGGNLTIPLSIDKGTGMKGAYQMQAAGLPGYNKPAIAKFDTKASETSLAIDLKNANGNQFTPGDYTIHGRATGVMSYQHDLAGVAEAEEARKKAEEAFKASESERVNAEKEKNEAFKQTITDELKKGFEAKLKAATDKANTSKAARDAANKEAQNAKNRAKPRDIRIVAHSQPIRIRITSSPIKVATPIPDQKTSKGGKLTMPVKVERLYGYKGEIEVKLVPPKGAKGLPPLVVKIPADKSEASIEWQIGPDAEPKAYPINVEAHVKFNNTPLSTTSVFTLTVDPS